MSDDGWEKVAQPAGDDGWEKVSLAERPAPVVGEALPEAFMGRLRAGEALGRVLSAAGKGAVEGMAGGTPTGFEDDTLNYLIEKGVFHDPATGRPGPLQAVNETLLMPAAQLWQGISQAVAGGIHGAGGAMEQIVGEFGGSQGEAARAKREVINLGNYTMIEAGMGRFARPSAELLARDALNSSPAKTVMDRTVGGLPTPQDFTNAAKVLDPKSKPASNLRLVEAPEGGVYTPEQVKPNEKYFKAVDANGNAAAEMLVRFDGKTANIEDILAPEKPREEGRGTIGTADMRSLLRQFQEAHPEVEKITGKRVSGARMGGGYSLLDEPTIVEMNLRRMWQEDGIHPAEAVHDAQTDAFFKHEIVAKQEPVKLDPETEQLLTESGGKPGSLSAAASEPGDVPLAVQPASPPSSLIATATAAADKLFDIGRDIQMKLAPMARGTTESMATVKDYMNSMRRNAWDSSRIDTDIAKRFTAEQRERMARAMEEESLSLRLEEPASAREHQGLATLEPEERAAVIDLDTRQQLAWLKARDLGMVEGDGIPMHFPRMALGVKVDSEIGKPPSLTQMYGIRKNSPYLKKREYMEAHETEAALKAKYGEQAKIAWDIRAVNMATKTLEDAIAGRTLINNIEEVGKRTGEDSVAVGWKPGDGWFTVDHPAFQKWRPKLEDGGVVKDEAGNPVFESVPIYVRGDFEGPIRSALWGKSSEAYQGLMALKGKTMGLIMYSPMIHNMVELGRAAPAMPLRMHRVYFDGYRAKNDVATMHEAISHGLVPIGKRFFNQDIDSVMEAPDLVPGRSMTAKIAAAIPGLFDEAAGTAVKRAVDKMGDFYHNTLLWDRIADLQMGLYKNFMDDMVAKGMDRDTASYIAAHWANRYAGALPKEAMSEAATKFANFALFSRSFTLGNLGVMKDALTGLPKDVLAQIERDAGFKTGSIAAATEETAQAATTAKSMARRKAMMILGLDIALAYAGNSVLQSAFNVLLGGNTLDQEAHEYLRRFKDYLNEASVHPLSLLQPFRTAESLSATNENEPNRKDRIQIGYAKDGTAIYARNPVGKIGEEFIGYFSSPLDMLRKKEGTIMRPLMQIISNDAGFGRKIYDPQAETYSQYASNVGAIVKHLVASQLPVQPASAAWDLIHGEGDTKVNALQTVGPFLGFTFSKGAPGGPAVGEMYAAKSQHEFVVNQRLPDIRRQIRRGDIDGARSAMTEIDIPGGLQNYYIKTTLNPALRMSPRAVRDFYLHATDEQKQRFDRARGRAQPAP